MKKKWLSAAAAAVLSVCALAAPISIPNTVTPVAVQAASSGTTLADIPSTYQSAAEWILQNRIISEGSVKDWATIYDQIVAGNGTLKYVVKWQSKQTITLEQRKQLQTVLETAVNDWTDWLVGYENWPYTHVNVQIVGWAVLDQNCLLDLQPDETVYTTTIPADTRYITDGNMAVSELPTLEPSVIPVSRRLRKSLRYVLAGNARHDRYGRLRLPLGTAAFRRRRSGLDRRHFQYAYSGTRNGTQLRTD